MNKLYFALLALVSIPPSWAQPSAEPIVLGWSGPLTGNCAVVGVDTLPTLRALVDDANASGGIAGRPLRLVAEDDGYDVVRAVSAYRKLEAVDKATVIFAETYGGVFATAREAQSDGVLVIDTLDCNEDLASLSENTLCIGTKTESIAEGFAADISARGFSNVLLLVEESDGWMQVIARALHRLLDPAGISVLEESAPAGGSDYRDALLRARSRGVQAIILLGNDQMGTAVRQVHQLAIRAQLYGIGSVLSPGFQALAGTVDGILVSSWRAPREAGAYRSFLDGFVARSGREPYLELAVVPAYDALRLTIDCLRRAAEAGKAPDAAAVRNCLLAVKDYRGASGSISFDNDGAVRSIREQLYAVKNGRLIGR